MTGVCPTGLGTDTAVAECTRFVARAGLQIAVRHEVRRWFRGARHAPPTVIVTLVGLALIGAQQVVAESGVAQASWHAAMNLFCGLAVLVGVQRHRPRRPNAWRALASGLALFALSNLGWAATEAGRAGVLGPALDAGAKLLAVVAFGAALLAFLHDGRLRCAPDMLLDGALVLTGSVLLLVQLGALTNPGNAGQATGVGLDSIGLLVLSVALFTVALRMVLASGGATFSMILLVIAAALVLLGQGLVVVTAPLEAPRWVDATWLLAAVLNAVAALHPSMTFEEAPAGLRRAYALTPARLAVIGMVLLVSPVVLWLTVLGAERQHYLVNLQLLAFGAITALGIAGAGDAGAEDDSGPLSG